MDILQKLLKTITFGAYNQEKKFEQEVMEPAENELNQMTEENKSLETNVWDKVSNFINENVVEKAKNLKDKISGKFEDFKETIFGSQDQDLGELSQEFLDAKENGDIDKMNKLSSKIIKINSKEEAERYAQMSEKELYSAPLAEGLAGFDTEIYRETLDEQELKKSDKILEAMKIATKEKYINNDFYTNEELLTNIISDLIKDDDYLNSNAKKQCDAIGRGLLNGIGKRDDAIRYNNGIYNQEEYSERFIHHSGGVGLNGLTVARLNEVGHEYREHIEHKSVDNNLYYGALKREDSTDAIFLSRLPEDKFHEVKIIKTPAGPKYPGDSDGYGR